MQCVAKLSIRDLKVIILIEIPDSKPRTRSKLRARLTSGMTIWVIGSVFML
jgi:hypothetical protein